MPSEADDSLSLREVIAQAAACTLVGGGLLALRREPPTGVLTWGYVGFLSILGGTVASTAFGWVFGWFTKRVRRLPLSEDPAQMSDEIYAILFPRSSEARRVAKRRSCGVDHLVYTCADLQKGVQAVEKLTGVKAAVGGSHPGVGTHNALLSLGADVYLEIIAPDPGQPTPAAPRPFTLDDPATHGRIVAFAVHPNASEGASIELLAAAMQRARHPPGPIAGMSRMKPDGSLLHWRLTPLSRASGPRPWIITWDASAHPATTSPTGCSLRGLRCHGPAAAAMRPLLLETMGLQPLASGAAVEFVASEGPPHMVATLDTPKGRVEIGNI